MIHDLLKNEFIFSNEVEIQANSIDNPGLVKGKLGIVIVYYLLAKQSGDNLYAKKGLQLLEWISETGVSSGDLSFANGLTGVGWAIEWLAQNELIEETNTDEVLEPIDNILYKAVFYVKDDNLKLLTGTLGKIAYFLKRASSCNPNTNRYKTIGHLECLILLLDDLAAKVDDLASSEINLTDLGDILCYISSVRVKVNTPTLEKILFDSVNKIELILSVWDNNSTIANGVQNDNYLDLLYLAVCYLIAAKNKNNKYWQAQALMHIERIVPVIDNICELTIEQIFKKLTIYSLININSPAQHYQKVIEKLIATLSPMEMPPTLVNGRGALVIAELSLINPGLISNWQEVMLLSKTM